uniref:Uncharacterized protein n=1 Tax=Arundo donax TaxID=35708 RepID=A0A0A9CNA5_ARUDO
MQFKYTSILCPQAIMSLIFPIPKLFLYYKGCTSDFCVSILRKVLKKETRLRQQLDQVSCVRPARVGQPLLI